MGLYRATRGDQSLDWDVVSRAGDNKYMSLASCYLPDKLGDKMTACAIGKLPWTTVSASFSVSFTLAKSCHVWIVVCGQNDMSDLTADGFVSDKCSSGVWVLDADLPAGDYSKTVAVNTYAAVGFAFVIAM